LPAGVWMVVRADCWIGISNGYAKLGMILFEMKATAKDLARELA